MEEPGFEPGTFRMRSGRSTTELHPQTEIPVWLQIRTLEFLPNARRMRLSVGRVLRLTRKVFPVVLNLGPKPEDGDRLEPFPVRHEFLDRLDALGDDRAVVVEPGDLKE